MLWYKGWLETKWRFVFGLTVYGLMLVLAAWGKQDGQSAHKVTEAVAAMLAATWLIIPVMLAGAGINTQTAYAATQGVHGSMLFTLSLPVSRIRLLLVRASVGAMESVLLIFALCAGAWLLLPLVRSQFTFLVVLTYALTVIAGGSAVYAFSVLLATVLDEMWQFIGGVILLVSLYVLSIEGWLPTWANPLAALGSNSLLATARLPVGALAVSIVAAIAFFWLAAWIVQTKEY